jgi:hypothetical protein
MDGVTPEAGPETSPGAYAWPPVVAFPPPQPPPDPRRRRVLVAIATAWALVLVGAGIWYALHGSPTVRDQTTIAQAEPRVDAAVGRVLAVAGTDTVPAVTGYEKTGDCDLTPVRTGSQYQRAVRLYTRVGGERDLLGRVAAGLPKEYRARLRGGSLVADAGYYVLVNGTVEQPGVVRVVASTGCRSLGDPVAGDPDAQPPAGDRAAIDPVLAALGAGPVRWSTHRMPCGVRTVEAVMAGSDRSLGTALRAAAAPLVSGDNVYAFRDGAAAVAARRSGDTVTVTATTGSCQ